MGVEQAQLELDRVPQDCDKEVCQTGDVEQRVDGRKDIGSHLVGGDHPCFERQKIGRKDHRENHRPIANAEIDDGKSRKK